MFRFRRVVSWLFRWLFLAIALAGSLAAIAIAWRYLEMPPIHFSIPTVNVFQVFMVGLGIGAALLTSLLIQIIPYEKAGIVERFGVYQRVLQPGLNIAIPWVDRVALVSTREQLLDIAPQYALTRDNVTIGVNAVLFWKVLNVAKAFYAIEHLDEALQCIALTTLQAEIGQMDLREVLLSRIRINQALMRELTLASESWGVAILRAEIQDIRLSPSLERALETERAAESDRRAAISRTEATVESIRRLSTVFETVDQPLLRYLLAEQYINACEAIAKSESSKVLFMNPNTLTEVVSELIR